MIPESLQPDQILGSIIPCLLVPIPEIISFFLIKKCFNSYFTSQHRGNPIGTEHTAVCVDHENTTQLMHSDIYV